MAIMSEQHAVEKLIVIGCVDSTGLRERIELLEEIPNPRAGRSPTFTLEEYLEVILRVRSA